MTLCLRIALALACLSSAFAQNPEGQNRRKVINFAGTVDSHSVDNLMRAINGQLPLGIRKFTILISSGGGDTRAAVTAFDFLRTVPAEITTFNVGNVYGAAVILYCAGYYRYSLPGPGARFILQPASLNDAAIQVVASFAPGKLQDLRNAVQERRLLTPEQAMDWGIVQKVRNDFVEPGSTLIPLNSPLPLMPFIN